MVDVVMGAFGWVWTTYRWLLRRKDSLSPETCESPFPEEEIRRMSEKLVQLEGRISLVRYRR